MLRYTEFGLSHQEVPNESAICIYISGCPNRCRDCHYPELQDWLNGEILRNQLPNIIDLYYSQATCVCFLGEGGCSQESKNELLDYVKYITVRGVKVYLYSGRDVSIEEWMDCFDYVKLGSNKEEQGDLHSKTTNQRFFQKKNGVFVDRTELFW